MEIDLLIKRCKRISLVSFLLGTLLLILFFFSNSYNVAMGAVPIIAALVLGNIVFLYRLIKFGITVGNKRREVIKTGFIMVANIPVAIFYLYFVLVLFDVVIVRFKNGINNPIEEARVIGCEERNIGQMKPGETEIEWIQLRKGCFEKSILIQYELNGRKVEEIVYAYVVDGRRINYIIGNERNLVVRE